MTSRINPHVLRYLELVDREEFRVCKDQKQLAALVRHAFETEDIYTDDQQLEKYLGLGKYFPYESVFPWEEFLLALHMCTYRASDHRPRWPDLLLMGGRGLGKDGYIALVSMGAASHYNTVPKYDVDICANSEEQARMPFDDCWNVLEDPRNIRKMQRFFYWNMEMIRCLKTGSRIKYRTNNPKGKDGLRSGMVIFNEIHQYLNYDNIDVFTTGLGKKAHPRKLYATTNGYVRDGPLDDYLKNAEDILSGKIEDSGFLPFVCRLDNPEEVHDERNWTKANPSLPYRPDLYEEIRKEYRDWKMNPANATSFMVKRMNLVERQPDTEVTSWENIMAACQPLPNVVGKTGVLCIDFALIGDMLSVVARIPHEGKQVIITHSWLCLNSKDIHRIKAPYRDWASQGFLTLVNDAEINPDAVVDWIEENIMAKYTITMLCIDKFRWPLLLKAVSRLGFSFENKNVKFVRPSDQAMVVPVVQSAFTNRLIVWGDNPLMRWAANNTKLVSEGINKSRGNYTFGKIEPKSRKNDPFMALMGSMTVMDGEDAPMDDLGALPDVAVY